RALGDCRASLPRIDAADHDVNTIQPAFRIKLLGNPGPVQAPKQIEPVGEDDRFVKPYFRTTEGLPYTVRWRDHICIQQSYVEAFRVAICEEGLMQVRQPGRDRTPVPATAHHQHPYLVLQQFWMNMVHFHGFMVLPVSAQTPAAFGSHRQETGLETYGFALPTLTRVQETRRGGWSDELHHSDE